MLSRIATAAAITLCVGSVVAGPNVDTTCRTSQGTGANCVPFVGCLGENGSFFTGRAIGWDKGTLAVRSSTGAFCSGDWVARNFLGVGQANISCDDGTHGIAYFTYQDPETGTATGHGLMSNGAKLTVWSGQNIRQFLADTSGTVNDNLICGEVVVPIS